MHPQRNDPTYLREDAMAFMALVLTGLEGLTAYAKRLIADADFNEESCALYDMMDSLGEALGPMKAYYEMAESAAAEWQDFLDEHPEIGGGEVSS